MSKAVVFSLSFFFLVSLNVHLYWRGNPSTKFIHTLKTCGYRYATRLPREAMQHVNQANWSSFGGVWRCLVFSSSLPRVPVQPNPTRPPDGLRLCLTGGPLFLLLPLFPPAGPDAAAASSGWRASYLPRISGAAGGLVLTVITTSCFSIYLFIGPTSFAFF